MKKFWNSIKTWIGGLFKDESGSPSSKRFVGIVCGLSLCVVLFTEKTPNSAVVDAVALLAFGCLGLSSIDKFTATKKQISEAISKQEDVEEITACPTCGQDPCPCKNN